jgi:hypothetical protein
MPYGSGGDDGERGHMARPYIVEVSAVHGGNDGDAQPFGDCYQRGVGAAQPPIGVLPDEFGHPLQVGVSESHWAELTSRLAADRIEELRLGDRTAEPVDEVARLGQNGDRKGELSVRSSSQRRQRSCAVSDRSASATMTLVSTRITTAGQRPKPSASSSSTRCDRSWRRLSKLPTNSGSGRRPVSAAVERDCAIGSTARSARSTCSSFILSTSRCSRSRVVMDPLCQSNAEDAAFDVAQRGGHGLLVVTGNTQIHEGDVNSTGVKIENMNFQRGDDGDDVVRSLNQQGLSVGGQWLNRGWP